MSWKESVKSEWQKFKEIPNFKKKMEYIWDYYRFFIIGAIFILLLGYPLSSSIYHKINFKEVFYCAIFNNPIADPQYTELIDSFSDYYHLNSDTQYITINDSFSYSGYLVTKADYRSMQKIGAIISSKTLDCMIGNDDIINQYATDNALYDLETILPSDIYDTISDALCWYSPTSGGEKRPYTIDLSMSTKKDLFYTDSPRLGIIINSQHTDAAIAFIRYLFGL